MKTAICSIRRAALLVVSCSMLVVPTVVQASIGSELQPLADKQAPSLPIAVSFDKGTPGENGGPYIAKLKNTSSSALKVNATIIWSVASHNRAKTINLPPHTIEAGETWSISDLAAHDRVIVSADGYEKLEVTTPPGKTEK